MTFPALPYEVDGHLVAGLRALYASAEHLRKVPLDRLGDEDAMRLKDALGRIDATKDLLYLLRMGKQRTDDVAPVDLLGPGNVAHRLKPVTKRIFELLADGEWHDYEPVIREAAKEARPGEAHRRMEHARNAKRQEPGERTRNNDAVYLVERGQRATAVKAAYGKRIEKDPPPPDKPQRMRLRPPDLARPKKVQ
jgi:hypothetical protein